MKTRVVFIELVVGLLDVLINKRMKRMKRKIGREKRFRVNWVCLSFIKISMIFGIAKKIVNRNRANFVMICLLIFIVSIVVFYFLFIIISLVGCLFVKVRFK